MTAFWAELEALRAEVEIARATVSALQLENQTLKSAVENVRRAVGQASSQVQPFGAGFFGGLGGGYQQLRS